MVWYLGHMSVDTYSNHLLKTGTNLYNPLTVGVACKTLVDKKYIIFLDIAVYILVLERKERVNNQRALLLFLALIVALLASRPFEIFEG